MQGLTVRPFTVGGLSTKATISRPVLLLPRGLCPPLLSSTFGTRLIYRSRKAAVKAIIEDLEENVKLNEKEVSESDLGVKNLDELDDLDDLDDLDGLDGDLDEDLDMDEDSLDDLDMDDDDDLDDDSLENGAQPQAVSMGKGKDQVPAAAAKSGAAGSDIQKTIKVDAKTAQDESLQLENCGLSPVTVKALAKKKIFALFPIQKEVFQPAMDGKDMICRAKTGSGKTLAFALPIVESLIKEKDVKDKRKGRTPRCLVLTPTRELAKQVEEEFQSAAPSLNMGVFYGGVSIMNQQRTLRNGVDAVVGTPGRVIDLIERGDLRLNNLRHLVLDESDMMLDMGFQEDVERIAAECPPDDRQTLMFSATLPQWVKKLAKKYQKNPILVDLVGEENTGRIADTIKPLAIQVDWKYKRNLLVDLLSVYGSSGKSIVFTSTKREADEVSAGVGQALSCDVLHGDISQAQREKTLQKFRDGKIQALVATDVASRGLDIPNVDLVLHYDIPQNPESYLHRSGRTGRAGKTGTTIAMFAPRDRELFYRLMQDTKTKVEIIGPPLPQDTMKSAALNVYKKMANVNADVSQFFLPAAAQMLDKGDPSKVLASALAALSGFQEVAYPKSILTYEEGFMTLIAVDKQRKLETPNVLMRFMREEGGQHIVDNIGRIEVVDDRTNNLCGIAFDLPVEVADEALKAVKNPKGRWKGIALQQLKVMPVDFTRPREGRSRGRSGSGGRSDYRGSGTWGGRGRDGGYGDRNRDRGGRDRWEGRGRQRDGRDNFGRGGGGYGRGRGDRDDYGDFDDFGGGRGRSRGNQNDFGGRQSRGGGGKGGRGGKKGGDFSPFDDQFDMMGY
eukprot:TRINITY_DN2457_c0_g1_i6.p1 TRINITY_DN2457_c0_g1~~TRINITY_DN2457_c0_g1_i6.p1  ORF type:complete len:844 (-),score=204.54 TRINITY_DN2457_c0_g1_i6:424-2955(-)